MIRLSNIFPKHISAWLSILFLILVIQTAKANTNCDSQYNLPKIENSDDYESIVYIDPGYSGNELGTFENPFNSWEDITISANTAYLIKSGTSLSSGISINGNHNYIGKYGTGDRPIISQFLRITGEYVTIDSVQIISYGNAQYQKVIEIGSSKYITIANSYITGLVGTYDYPYYLVRGTGENMVFYNNIMSGAKEDGLYIGSSPNFTFVRNWVKNTNMGGVDKPYGGDGIQLEYDSYYKAYFAGNLIDRSNTMSKFCLILNGEDLTHNVTCIYNTFIAPKNGNGGAAVRWLGGDSTLFNNNLTVTFLEDDTSSHKVSGIATYNVSANQEFPYGIRDNHFVGLGNMFFGISSYAETNLKFASFKLYDEYLETNSMEIYGSDIDTNNFWDFIPCYTSPIATQFKNDLLKPEIFPNPVKDILSVRFNSVNSSDFEVSIHDLSGQKIHIQKMNILPNKVITVDTGLLKPGLYLIHFIGVNDGEFFTQRFIKN